MRKGHDLVVLGRAIIVAILHLLLFLSVSGKAYGQGQWYTGVGEALMLEVGYEEACVRARDKALKSALEKASGTEVWSSNLLYKMESNDIDGITDLFVSMIRTQTFGRIINQADTSCEMIPGSPPRCRYLGRFEVVPDTGRPDSEFALSLKLNGQADVLNLLNGDRIAISVGATKDCYLTLFNVYSNDSLSVIFPNNLVKDNFLARGSILNIPPAKSGWSLTANLLPGRDHDQETIIAVVTKVRHPFRFAGLGKEWADDSITKLHSMPDALGTINRWLMDIEIDQRATAMVMYRIHK